MEQPEGFFNPKYPNRVCKLKRSIYGLKQASMQWNKHFDDEIKKFGFSQNADEPCVYLKASGSNVTFLILYVDDILIMGNSIPMLQDVKSYIGKCFAMKDLGEAAYILGITKGARHFNAKVYYLREVIKFGDIKLEKVHTDDNLAYPFTKALAFPKHSELTRNIGMFPVSSLM
ncbi:retrotransposon protein, putative, ty1-copia subclass [Tanacetum coccineum]